MCINIGVLRQEIREWQCSWAGGHGCQSQGSRADARKNNVQVLYSESVTKRCLQLFWHEIEQVSDRTAYIWYQKEGYKRWPHYARGHCVLFLSGPLCTLQRMLLFLLLTGLHSLCREYFFPTFRKCKISLSFMRILTSSLFRTVRTWKESLGDWSTPEPS